MGDPLRIYDIEIDGWREPTQADIDCFMALNRAYGKIRMAAKGAHHSALRSAIVSAHNELLASVADA